MNPLTRIALAVVTGVLALAPAASADAGRTPTPENYRPADAKETAAMRRAVLAKPRIVERAQLGRTRAAFIGKIDPAYGFVCVVQRIPADTGPLDGNRAASDVVVGIGVRRSAGRWKTWEMDSGAMQSYAGYCDRRTASRP